MRTELLADSWPTLKAVRKTHSTKTVISYEARASKAQKTGGTILPGLINSHAHLAWDGIHDLANQSLSDGEIIGAYKCANSHRHHLCPTGNASQGRTGPAIQCARVENC